MSLLQLLVMTAVAIPAVPQSENAARAVQDAPPPVTATTAVLPQQLRRVPPPPADASAAQLESTADDLCVDKAYPDALDYYHAAMRKADSAVLHDKAGIAELQMMRLGPARHEFEEAVRLDKNYAEAYNNLGVILYMRRDYQGATRLYQRAIRMRPQSAPFHSNLGTAYFARHWYGHAINEYVRAVQLDPDIFERRDRGGVAARMATTEDLGRYDYVLAKMYAAAGISDRCLLYLQKAMEAGYSGISDVYRDPQFAKVRKDPRFTALMSSKPVAIPPQ